jgi:hypothetical protein
MEIKTMPKQLIGQPEQLINAIGDGNCAYNSFAIWLALHYLACGPEFIHRDQLNTAFGELFRRHPQYRKAGKTDQESFYDFLAEHDLYTIQTMLAPILRAHSVTYLQETLRITDVYPDVRNTLKNSLCAAFREYASQRLNIILRESGGQQEDTWKYIPETKQVFDHLLQQLPRRPQITSIDALDRWIETQNIYRVDQRGETIYSGSLSVWFEETGCNIYLKYIGHDGFYVNHTPLAALAQSLGLGFTVERNGQVWAQYDGNPQVTLVNEVLHWNARIHPEVLQNSSVQLKVNPYITKRRQDSTLNRKQYTDHATIAREFDRSLKYIEASVQVVNGALLSRPGDIPTINRLPQIGQQLLFKGIRVDIDDIANLQEANDTILAIQLQKEEIELFWRARQRSTFFKNPLTSQHYEEARQYASAHPLIAVH